ncbi:acetyl-CoA carboxylase biotin carboxyl carrier protein subunit [Agrobacterium leguminum]|uniref:Acetyl-CoA carboxylase biotin carboxyl carrier protein subunit n=1 Tax=Agrobacterium leguminum TaxID=2792015 RepID=A0A9X3KGS4_9HYPH|nr:biotin/lipoyl-containing protein [Agrobacterium leguminum]MCZ7911428.1 acetyl-CoA carboxylase biotin carboxyl carrier protein subunit [Agrobacterium leguminum]
MDLDKIKALLDYMGRSRVQEMRVTQDGTTVVIRNAPVHVPASMSSTMESTGTAVALDAGVKEAAVETKTIVRAPAPGIVHQAASPGAPALAQVGAQVEAGYGLCVLEAMKVFTTVPAPLSGAIKRVFFEDGAEVAAGDPLVEIC